MELWTYEAEAKAEGYAAVCGADEAGRGPLAGPVYAAAVILDENDPIPGLNDSKKLTPLKRERLYEQIKLHSAAYAVAWADVDEIDRLNILHAAMLAMKRAVEALDVKPDLALIDGNRAPELEIPARTIIHGDGLSASIAAASIMAKVDRDAYMKELDEKYPRYQFAKHKGYPTALHYEMLARYGPCPAHRRSFRLGPKE